MSVTEPEAEVHFVRRPDDTTVTVRLEGLENADHVRVHAAGTAGGDRHLPVVLSEPGDSVEIADLADDDLITITAVGDGIEQLVARYQQ